VIACVCACEGCVCKKSSDSICAYVCVRVCVRESVCERRGCVCVCVYVYVQEVVQ